MGPTRRRQRRRRQRQTRRPLTLPPQQTRPFTIITAPIDAGTEGAARGRQELEDRALTLPIDPVLVEHALLHDALAPAGAHASAVARETTAACHREVGLATAVRRVRHAVVEPAVGGQKEEAFRLGIEPSDGRELGRRRGEPDGAAARAPAVLSGRLDPFARATMAG